jgi:putative hydrolase
MGHPWEVVIHLRFFADWHTHTCYSHGTGTVLDNAYAAQRRGLKEIAIADHGPANLFGVGVRNLATYASIHQDIEDVKRQVPTVNVLFAAEANIIDRDGAIDIPPSMQDKFDLLLVGLHILVKPQSLGRTIPVALSNIMAKVYRQGEQAALVKNTDMLVAAVYRNRVHIVTHPGYRLPIDTLELAKACVLTGTALEINSSHHHTTSDYLRQAAKTGVYFAVGSDAHQPERVGDLSAGWYLAKQAGIDPHQVLNMAPVGREWRIR